MLKILYILPSTFRGGAEIYLFRLLSHVRTNGVEVTLLMPECELANWYKSLGITVIQTPYFSGLFSGQRGGMLRTYFKYFFLKGIKRYDLIHSNSLYSLRAGQYFARKFSCPLIVHWHDNVVPMWALKYFKKSPMTIVAPSPAAQTTVMNALQSTVKCIPNPVDCDLFFPRDQIECRRQLGLPVDRFLLGFFAVLNRHKGLDILLDILPALPHDVILVVAGLWDSSEAKVHYVKRFEEPRIKNRIIFLGFRDDMPEIFCAMDAMCAPSENEAMPLVGLEALASGCPVFAHPVGGYSDIIQPGYNGDLISIGDRRAWIDALTAFFSNSSRRIDMRKNARESITSYSVDRHVNSVLELYAQLS